MNKKLLTIFLIACVLSIACESQENYILLRSMDNEQSAEFNIGEIEVYQNTAIDTTVLLKKMRSYKYSNRDFSNVITDDADSMACVVRVDKEYRVHEGEVYISIFFEIKNAQISELFCVETGQNPWCWKLEKDQMNTIKSKDDSIELKAIIKSVEFAISDIIRFPYNDKGLYDYDIDRYMKLDLQFNLDENEEILKYLKK